VSLASFSFAKEERELLRDGALNNAELVLATGGSTLPTGSSPRASPPQPALQRRRSQLRAASNNRAAPIRSFLAERNNWPHWPLDLAISRSARARRSHARSIGTGRKLASSLIGPCADWVTHRCPRFSDTSPIGVPHRHASRSDWQIVPTRQEKRFPCQCHPKKHLKSPRCSRRTAPRGLSTA
jgi:hypothetical protein